MTEQMRKSIPKGWRILRIGERLSFPYKVWNEYYNRFDDGYNNNSSINKRVNRDWTKCLIPKNREIYSINTGPSFIFDNAIMQNTNYLISENPFLNSFLNVSNRL